MGINGLWLDGYPGHEHFGSVSHLKTDAPFFALNAETGFSAI
jgi:hypothetical protein